MALNTNMTVVRDPVIVADGGKAAWRDAVRTVWSPTTIRAVNRIINSLDESRVIRNRPCTILPLYRETHSYFKAEDRGRCKNLHVPTHFMEAWRAICNGSLPGFVLHLLEMRGQIAYTAMFDNPDNYPMEFNHMLRNPHPGVIIAQITPVLPVPRSVESTVSAVPTFGARQNIAPNAFPMTPPTMTPRGQGGGTPQTQ